ncbi:MAG: LysR family transcriptional regulator [Actinomycetota bacterium]|nr:LysR family transcriptional regulator [Actinomycetota bacterium]
MTVRLPFTLTPHEGQDLTAWICAYATHLDVTASELADALGLPDQLPRTGGGVLLDDRHIETIATASGLSVIAIEAMCSAIPRSVPAAHGGVLSVVERLRQATTLSPRERLQQATTMHHRRTTTTKTDPAIERAGRLPDQVWPAWAIRLVDDDAFEATTFGPSMLAALLLPHSDLPLKHLAALVGEAVQPATVAFHLRKVLQVTNTAAPLQILTELAFAVDTHDLPIDYARRRRIVADVELIDARTWAGLARAADARSGRDRRARFAGRYLYELLTGGNLRLAPAPYRIDSGFERIEYHDFVAGLPRPLVDALHTHARELLDQAGITREPLQWEPPTSWVSATDWPGSDPDLTDPEPIHEAVCSWRARHRHVAASLGISTQHLRYVIRRHPRTWSRYPTRRKLTAVGSADEHRPPAVNTISLDPDWLRSEYVTWRRPLPDIAAELGCKTAVLKVFAHQHHIPLRRRSGPDGFAHLDLPGVHPSQVPEPLRSVLVGRDTRQRLSRFVILAKHASLNQAAQALGVHQCTLTSQLQQLERACGGLLLYRHPRPQPVGPLTPLGEQLHRQVIDHLHDTAA